MNQYKTCTKCKQDQVLENFGNDKTRADGKFPQCKSCTKAYQQKNYQRNKDRVKANAKRWKQENPERVKEIRQKYLAEHAKENREYQRRWAAEYRKNNPLNHRRWVASPEKLKQWRKANPEKYRNQKLRRRSREKGTGQFLVTSKDIKRLLTQPCIYCGQPSQHIDHIIPVSRGGEHRVGNLAPACARCNLTKSDRYVMEWKFVNK